MLKFSSPTFHLDIRTRDASLYDSSFKIAHKILANLAKCWQEKGKKVQFIAIFRYRNNVESQVWSSIDPKSLVPGTVSSNDEIPQISPAGGRTLGWSAMPILFFRRAGENERGTLSRAKRGTSRGISGLRESEVRHSYEVKGRKERPNRRKRKMERRRGKFSPVPGNSPSS